jgi:hypothetical protein
VSASIEDAAGVGRETFVADLSRLLAAVEGVLARIDALVDFTGQPTDPTAAARPTDRTSSSSRCRDRHPIQLEGPHPGCHDGAG